MKKLLGILIFVFFAYIPIASAQEVDINWDAGPLEIEKGHKLTTAIKIGLEEGYYLYVEKTYLEFTTLEGIRITRVSYPQKEVKRDPLDGSPTEVYLPGDILVDMMVSPESEDGTFEVDATLYYQACSDNACLKPDEKLFKWAVEVLPGATPHEDKTEDSGFSIKYNTSFIMAFFGGILSSFTPCVLPLIPVLLLIIGVRREHGWFKNITLSLALVLGMSITYAALGLISASLGKTLGFLFQSRLFVAVVVIFFFAMALSMFGLFDIKLPAFLRNFFSRLGGHGLKGAFLSGVGLGFLASPCLGPVIGSLLVYSAHAGDHLFSFMLLFVYGLGLGTVIVVFGSGYGVAVSRLKKTRVKWVKKFIGLLLLIPALYYLNSVVPYTSAFNSIGGDTISWELDYKEAFSSGPVGSRPMMVLFSADWCLPCKILDVFTLNRTDVRNLAKNFRGVKVDTTHLTPENEALVRKFGVVGWPTIVFLSPGGAVYEDLTVTMGRDLVKNMEEALRRSK